MRKALLISILFHGAVVGLIAADIIVFGEDDYPEFMEVEIIEYDEIADQSYMPPPEPEPEEAPLPEPELEPEPEPEPAPRRIEEAAPELPPPLPPEPTEAAPAAPVQVARATQAVPNITPRDKPAPPSRFNINRIEALLDKRQEEEQKPPPRKFAVNEPDKEPTISSAAQRLRLASLEQAIHTQISRCWSAPVGASYAETLIVEIKIQLARDGSLLRPPEILNQSRLQSDSFFRAAAEAARRAVQRCTPLDLPVADYDEWKDTKLNFDPSKM